MKTNDIGVILVFLVLIGCADPVSVQNPSPPSPSVLSVVFSGQRGSAGRVESTLSTAAIGFDDSEGLLSSILRLGSKGNCLTTASWTQCTASDFQSYTLYRSEEPGISSNVGNADNLGTFTSSSTHQYSDSGVTWSTPYYYALLTRDTEGLSSWSNEVHITTPEEAGGPLPEGMEFVAIPQGSFQMGSPTSDPDSQTDERPVHTVTISYDFEMMITEVTQGMWQEVMGENPAHDYGVGDDYPVYYISWNDSQNFVEAMNDLDPDHEYRLPSEAEWEYCCRAGTTTRYYWGDDPSHSQIGQYAWYLGNSFSSTHLISQRIHNAWGLYDMNGNVWEWCQDKYHNNYVGAPSDGSAWESPSSYGRVLRGGGWNEGAEHCRSATRWNYSTSYCNNRLGLRLVRTER